MTTRALFAVLLTVTTCLVGLARPSTLLRAAPSDVEGRGPHDQAQGGDQFLDGIGETGLIARYVFNGNAEDSSRNQFHATVRGTGGAFVDDEQFRRVLLLTGDGSHVQLPGETLTGEDTLSVSGVALPAHRRARARSSTSARAPPRGSRAVANAARLPRLDRRWTAGPRARPPPRRFSRTSGSTSPSCSIRPRRVLTTYLDGAQGGPGDGRRRERRAARAPDHPRGEPLLPRPLAGRCRADAPRAPARRPHLSRRA